MSSPLDPKVKATCGHCGGRRFLTTAHVNATETDIFVCFAGCDIGR